MVVVIHHLPPPQEKEMGKVCSSNEKHFSFSDRKEREGMSMIVEKRKDEREVKGMVAEDFLPLDQPRPRQGGMP